MPAQQYIIPEAEGPQTAANSVSVTPDTTGTVFPTREANPITGFALESGGNIAATAANTSAIEGHAASIDTTLAAVEGHAASVDTKVTGLAQESGGHLASIDGVLATVEGHVATIDTSTAATATNTAAIEGHAAAIDTSTASIASHAASIDTSNTAIAASVSSINTHATAIDTSTTSTATNTAAIEGHAASIDTHAASIDTHSGNVDTSTAATATSTATVATNTTSINTHTSSIDTKLTDGTQKTQIQGTPTVNIGTVPSLTVGSSALPTGASTEATLLAVKNLLTSQLALSDLLVEDSTGAIFVRRDSVSETGTYTITFTDLAGVSATPVAPYQLATNNTKRQVIQYLYDVNHVGTGYSVGDIIARFVIIDDTASTNTVVSSAWLNLTTGAIISTPTLSDLTKQTQDFGITSTVLAPDAARESGNLSTIATQVTAGAKETGGNLAAIAASTATSATNSATNATHIAATDTSTAATSAGIGTKTDAQATDGLGASSWSVVSLLKGAVNALLNGTIKTSATSLPLPTGAATSAKQPAIGTTAAPSADIITVQGNASGVAIPVSNASLPLPTGAATSANQVTAQTSLTSVAANTLAESLGIGSVTDTKATDGLTTSSWSVVSLLKGAYDLLLNGTLKTSAASLPLPAGAAQDGTDGTGIVQPTGGAGIRGWLSGIYNAVITAITIQSSSVALATAVSVNSLNADLVASTDVSKYTWGMLKLTSVGSAGVSVQFSNDGGTTWDGVPLMTATVGNPSSNVTLAITGLFAFVRMGKLMRVRVTSYTSGTITGSVVMFTTEAPVQPLGMPLGTVTTTLSGTANGVYATYNSGTNGTTNTSGLSLGATAAGLKSGGGRVVQLIVHNTSASDVYLKLYNKNAPTIGTDTPMFTFYIPAKNTFTYASDVGIYLSIGSAIAATGAAAVSDTTAPTVNAIIYNVSYI